MTSLIALELDECSNIEARADAKLASTFAGGDVVLARGILALGTDAVRPLIALLHPALPRALPTVTDDDRQHSLAAKRILSFAMIAECTGVGRPRGFDNTALAPLIAGRKELSEPEQRSAALLALTLGDTATARGLIRAAPAAYGERVLSFEFNLYELIRYLADAIDQGRPSDWIEPVVMEYIAGFPLHRAADAAKWPDVVYVSRILADARGDEVRHVADELHARVQLLAKRGN